MRNVVRNVCSSTSLKLMLVSGIGLAVAGCSSEVTRFSGPLFGGGGASNSATQYTGSVTPSPTPQVQQSPLDGPGGQPGYGQTYSQQQGGQQMASLPAPTNGQYQGGYGAQAPAQPTKTHTVQSSDNLYSIARQYNIPPATLMQANGLTDPSGVRAGQQLVIPSFSQSTGSWQAAQQTQQPSSGAPMQQAQPQYQPQPQPQMQASLPQPSQPAPARASAPQGGGSHTVAHGDTLYSIARSYSATPRDIVSANGLDSPDRIRVGQRLTIPGANGAAPQQMASSAPSQPSQQAPQAQQLQLPQPDQQQVASLPQPTVQIPAKPEASEQPQPAALTTGGDQPSGQADTRAGLPDPAAMSAGNFRWPVRGRVISSFGDTADGGKNDGLNISVPEGTSVRAAENGVVAYAGSELKGFGNLILVRHSDDWVSAYAHNSELNVKRGDVVTRGQVIAKAGQTGSVSSPQLHFELRKGSQPVDPLRHLSEN